MSWSDHIAVLSKAAEVEPKLFYDSLTPTEAGCGSLYILDLVR